MLGALTKPLEGITAVDLKELTQHGWPESENVEYKAELHRENNRQDPWYNSGNVTEGSKKKIFKEVVALANTSGGRLFLGISETAEKPPRAESIKPVPRCAELAERLEQAIISSIDPPLTFFRVIGIPTESDKTSGVLVAEVSASYSGPHRSSDLHCYVRKGTNSVPVGMREIHDIVMRLSRRQDEIQRRLMERRDLFERWMGRQLVVNLQVGLRVTAIPVGAPLYIDRVFRNSTVSRDLDSIVGTWVKDQRTQQFPVARKDLAEQPVLGGTKWSSRATDRMAEKTIFRDGLIDTWFKWPWYQQHGSKQRPLLYFEWVIANSANALVSVEAFRKAAQAPACEYGLQLELRSINSPADTPLQLVRHDYGNPDDLGSEFLTPTILGPYPVGDRDKAINLIVRDLCDAAAIPEDPSELKIDWPTS